EERIKRAVDCFLPFSLSILSSYLCASAALRELLIHPSRGGVMLSFRERVRRLPEAERESYESTALRFEESWCRLDEEAPQIDAFLPPAEPVRLLSLVHLAKCDMEFRRQRGEQRRVEDYLAQFPALADDAAVKLELLVWEFRLTRADGVRVDEFERRFPDLAEPFRLAAEDLEPLTP